jgi:hypothetical protein
MKKVIPFLLIIISNLPLLSQETPTKPDTLRKDALNVFMDASDYVKKEILYVNYVRDIKDAGVYIISTSQNTGSGGTEYTYFLVGQHEFAGMRDTVSFVTTPDETVEGRRQKEVTTLKMALMRYVAKTPLSKYMKINFSEPLSETVSTDKWNNWVFRGQFMTYFYNEKSYKYYYISGNLATSHITEKWKINLNVRYSQYHNKYILKDTTLKSINDTKSVNALIVKSISDHWSYGGSAYISSSTYSNTKISYAVMPGIEYDLFPYSESTKRQLRLLYSIGYNHVNYMDSTIYDKMEDDLYLHSISASYKVVQKWGSIDVNLSYRNYLHDWSKNNLSFSGEMSLRVAKGLQVSFYGGASLIHDQLGLIKETYLTNEAIILQRKELETQYQYYSQIGLTYTFGSIYNNVVNPRFGN